jgi:small subunit ribosomal protein S12e
MLSRRRKYSNFKISIVPHRPLREPSPVSLVWVQAKHSQCKDHCTHKLQKIQPSEFTIFLITTTNLFFEDRKSFKHNQDGRHFLRDPGVRLILAQSDAEDNVSNAPDVAEAEEVEVSGDAASKGQMSVLDALKGVLKLALMHDGLARGLREASKALDRRQAHMCVLNEACEEEAYKKLVVALCSEHKIPLIKVPDGKQLGEWAGLCKCRLQFWEGFSNDLIGVLDREGNARKVVNCSCVVVKDWGEESQERSILLNYFQTEQ